jgi:hypothetical protein|tara:strand:- start:126 stop:302 length:177 start_codon:yes stop_codon:yes gene_type:complete
MHGATTKDLLRFIQADLSERRSMIQMIQNSIANRGKSFLASIVLALFVFGVVQMLSSA